MSDGYRRLLMERDHLWDKDVTTMPSRYGYASDLRRYGYVAVVMSTSPRPVTIPEVPRSPLAICSCSC